MWGKMRYLHIEGKIVENGNFFSLARDAVARKKEIKNDPNDTRLEKRNYIFHRIIPSF
jgi:hypothetical protein